MYQHTAFCLCGNYKQHTQQVRSESGPWGIGNCHNGTVNERLYLVGFLCRNVNVVTALLHFDAQASEAVGDNTQIFV